MAKLWFEKKKKKENPKHCFLKFYMDGFKILYGCVYIIYMQSLGSLERGYWNIWPSVGAVHALNWRASSPVPFVLPYSIARISKHWFSH